MRGGALGEAAGGRLEGALQCGALGGAGLAWADARFGGAERALAVETGEGVGNASWGLQAARCAAGEAPAPAAASWGVAGEPALIGAARETVVRALYGEGAEFLAEGAEAPPGAGRVLHVDRSGEYSYDALGAASGEGASARRLLGKAVVIPHSEKVDPTVKPWVESDKPPGYRIWLPGKEDMTTDPYGSLHLIANILHLVDNCYMRWYLQNGKCDFYAPKGLLPWKGPYEPGSVDCSYPDVKLSYCVNFRFNVPIVGWLVQPVVPLCLPLDVLDILFGLGPTIGGIVEDVLDQISPYIVQTTYDFINCGGSQEALMAVINGVMASGALNNPAALTEGLPDVSMTGSTSVPTAAPPNSLLPLLSQGLQSQAWLDLALPPFDAQCFMTGEGVSGLVNTALATEIVPAPFLPIVTGFDTIVNSYYNAGCTTEQLMVWLPALIDEIAAGKPLGIGTIYGATGTTSSGESVSFASGPPGLPPLSACTASSLPLFLGLLT